MNIDTSKKHNKFYIKTLDLTGKLYSDKTGRFLIISNKGNKYIIVIYNHNYNTILTRVLKSKLAIEILDKIIEIYIYPNKQGTYPSIHIIDNECSKLV